MQKMKRKTALKKKIKNIYNEDITKNVKRIEKQFKKGEISETSMGDIIYAMEQGEMY